MKTIYLTRRNLLTLINKLDRQARGDATHCAVIKNDTAHTKYPMPEAMMLVAIEDEDYYDEREPGPVHPSDDPRN